MKMPRVSVSILAAGLLAGVILVLFSPSWSVVRAVTFDYLQWVAGLTMLSLFGGAWRKLLRIPPCLRLNGFVNLLYGQVLMMLYFYGRTGFVRLFGLPGIHPLEFWLVMLLPMGAALFLAWPADARQPVRDRAVSLAGASLLFLLFAFIFFQMAPRLSTPCSDTDVHAFLARMTFEQGSLALISPFSDGVMIDYPGGFAVLNAVYMQLTRLTAVQVVNLQAYFQWIMLLGVWMAVWPSRRVPGSVFLIALFCLILWGWGGFNPFFMMHRRLLTGTARLSHTALFFFPALHLWVMRSLPGGRVGAFSTGFLVPVVVALAFCISPVHAVPVMIATGIGAGVVRLWRRTAGVAISGTERYALRTGWRIGLVTTVLIMAVDPGTGLAAWLSDAGGTGAWSTMAVRPEIAAQPIFATGPLPSILKTGCENILRYYKPGEWMPDFILASAFWIYVFLIVPVSVTVGMLAWLIQLRGERARISDTGYATLFLLLSTSLLFFWALICAFVFNPGSLPGSLAMVYSVHASLQNGWLMVGIFSIHPVLMVYECGWRKGIALTAMAAAFLWATVGLALIVPAGAGREVFRHAMTAEAVGEYGHEHMAAFRWLEEHIPPNERILLPVQRFYSGYERWVFPSGPAAGVALYSRVSPVFFYGFCGFDADDYEQYVANGFDLEWMKSERIFWVFDYEGNPAWKPEELHNRLKLVWQNGSVRIWHLNQ